MNGSKHKHQRIAGSPRDWAERKAENDAAWAADIAAGKAKRFYGVDVYAWYDPSYFYGAK